MLHALPRIEPPPGGTVLGTTDRNGPCKTSDCPRTAGKRPLALAANLRVVQGGFGCAGPVIGEASLGYCQANGTLCYLTRKIRKPQLRSRDERAPLNQRGRASLFVSLAGHEMTLLVEMIVDLRVN